MSRTTFRVALTISDAPLHHLENSFWFWSREHHNGLDLPGDGFVCRVASSPIAAEEVTAMTVHVDSVTDSPGCKGLGLSLRAQGAQGPPSQSAAMAKSPTSSRGDR